MIAENHHFVFQLSIERSNIHFDYSRSRTGLSVLSRDRSLQMKLRSSVILRSMSSPGITTLLVKRSRESLELRIFDWAQCLSTRCTVHGLCY